MIRARSIPAILAAVAACVGNFALILRASAAEIDGPETKLQEVVVTAQKREESVQQVPLAVTAFDAEALAKMGFTDLSDLGQKVPSVSIQPYPNASSTLVIFIRGVGQSDALQFARDPGVGIYLDDVYLAHGQGITMDLGDVDRVEVLRGPQGTLYGRNTIGGAVKVITAKPTGEWGFKETFDGGNFGYIRTLTAVNFPTVANISAKLSYLYSESDPWVTNSGTGGGFGLSRDNGFRAALRWRPTDSLTADYTYDHSEHRGTGLYEQETAPIYRSVFPWASPVFPNRLDQAWRPVDVPQKDNFVTSGHGLTVEWLITPATSLKSITAYRELSADQMHDTVEAFNIPSLQGQVGEDKVFSQELLLAGSTLNSKIKYDIGLYYARETGHQDFLQLANPFALVVNPDDPYYAFRPPTLADLGPPNHGDVVNESKAVYGQLTWTPPVLRDRLDLTVGARWTHDGRQLARSMEGSPSAENSNSYSNFDPTVNVDYHWSDNIHTYARYATGYRAGGFSIYATNLSPFKPEHLKSYELGLKSQWWNDRVVANLDVFKQDYTDIQLDTFTPDFLEVITTNLGSATIKGAEGDLAVLPVTGLTLRAMFTYLSASTSVVEPFTGAVTVGNTLPNTPKWKGNAQIEYNFARIWTGTLGILVTYDYNGEEGNAIGGTPTGGDLKPAFGLVGARCSLSHMKFSESDVTISVWGNNLADKEYQVWRSGGAAIFGQPRNYGLNITIAWLPPGSS